MSHRDRPKPDLRQIGLRIRGLRGDMRQEELASQLGVSQSQLSKVERGNGAPTLEILLGMAIKFGKSLDWIVKGDGSQGTARNSRKRATAWGPVTEIITRITRPYPPSADERGALITKELFDIWESILSETE